MFLILSFRLFSFDLLVVGRVLSLVFLRAFRFFFASFVVVVTPLLDGVGRLLERCVLLLSVEIVEAAFHNCLGEHRGTAEEFLRHVWELERLVDVVRSLRDPD